MKFRVIIDKAKEEEVVATVHQRTDLIDEIESLILRDEQTDALAAYQEDEIRLLELNDVECITADDGKVYAIADSGKRYLLKKRLYEIEESLPPEFIRINKSSIANRKRIRRFTTTISGAVDVEFKSGFKEYVSRRCFADLKRRYGL
ncbi:MAG: LytTR family transcriptional regulator [Eubacterium sp.]|nr:LytTR family transcriptional regulator [Eubacterium sp.]